MKIIKRKNVETIIGDLCGSITYNGNVIHVPNGSRVEIVDNKMLVNGKPFGEYDEAACPILKIEITGTVNDISTGSGDISVKGNVGRVKTMSGSVHCQTVEGNVSTMSGSVTCNNIAGDCSTMSGSIRR